MNTVSYPSETFPGFPEVVMDCPEGWVAHSVPQAQMAIIQERPEGQFRPNVVVVIQRMAPNQTVEALIEQAVERFRATPGFEEVGRLDYTFGGLPAVRIEGAWSTEETGTIAQALRIAVVEHDGVRDMVEVTGTCAGPQASELWPQVRDIQDSVKLADQ